MLYIEKQPCPEEIRRDFERQTSTPEWKELPEEPERAEQLRKFFDHLDKGRLRASLLREQHGLCAYCMKRIKNNGETTNIEHWYPLGKSKSRSMDYRNLLAVCNGGAGRRRSVVCCDASKENKIIIASPLNRDFVEHLIYYGDGRIDIKPGYENEEQLRNDLCFTLRLNGRVLSDYSMKDDTETQIVKGRKAVYEAYQIALEDLYNEGLLTPEWGEEEETRLTEGEEWDEFLGVKLFLLRQYL